MRLPDQDSTSSFSFASITAPMMVMGSFALVLLLLVLAISPFVQLYWLVPLVICFGLLLIADTLEASAHDLTGYGQLALVTLWLIADIWLALLMLGAALLIAMLLDRWVLQRKMPRRERFGLRLGLPLAAAALVYSALGGRLPLLSLEQWPLLAVGMLVSVLVYELLIWSENRTTYQGPWQPQRRTRWLTRVLSFGLAGAFAVVWHSDGTSVFVLLMVGIGAHVAYQQYFEIKAQETRALTDHVNDIMGKMRLVNQYTQNAMFRVDQEIAFQTACQTAMDVTQGQRAAIFVAGREGQVLNLTEAIGFTPAEMLQAQQIDFSRHRFTDWRTTIWHEKSDDDVLAPFHRPLNAQTIAEVPLRSGEAVLGFLVVYHQQRHQYNDNERELLEVLGVQITAALDTTQLLQTLEFHAFEMTHLVHLSRISTASLILNKVAADVTVVLRQMSGMDWAMIALLDTPTQRMSIVGVSGTTGEEKTDTLLYALPAFPEVLSLSDQIPSRPLTLMADQTDLSPSLKSYLEEMHLKLVVIAPMVALESMFGVIILGASTERALQERETQLIEAAANQVSTQIYNARLYRDTENRLRERLEELKLVQTIVQHMAESQNFNEITQDVFEAAHQTTHADSVALAMRTEADEFWVTEQVYPVQPDNLRAYVSGREDGLIGEVMRTSKPVFSRDHRRLSFYDARSGDGYLSSIAVPLLQDNGIIGVLIVQSCASDFFTHDQIDFLINLGAHAIISMENARLLEELTYQVEQLDSIRELSLTLASETDHLHVVKQVIKTAMSMTSSNYVAVFQMVSGQSSPKLMDYQALEGGGGSTAQAIVVADIAAQAVKNGDIHIVADVAEQYAAELAQGISYPTIAAVPIRMQQRIDYILCLGFDEVKGFTERELKTLSLLAAQTACHLENAALYGRIRSVNSRLQAILDSTRDGVVLLDERQRIIEVNPAVENLMGLNLKAHIGEVLVKVLLDHSTSDEGLAGYTREDLRNLVRAQRSASDALHQREFSRKLADEQVLYVEETGSPVHDERGQLVGRLLVLRDISEEKRLEQYRNEITGMAVHDLRAPLASIMNALNIASEQMDNPNGLPTIKRTNVIAQANASEMMDLVNTLLDIRKGKDMALERVPTSIMPIIELAQLRVEATAEKAAIPMNLVIQSNLPAVLIDPNKIQRVLVNLLDNAIRFTLSGKPVQISAEYLAEKGKVLVMVSDSGPGIPDKERSKVFEQYWQSKGSKPLRGSKGSGIGLAFCKRALEAHGEDIWVESVGPLPGATFAFTLPVA